MSLTFTVHDDLEFDLEDDLEGQGHFFKNFTLFLIAKLIKN